MVVTRHRHPAKQVLARRRITFTQLHLEDYLQIEDSPGPLRLRQGRRAGQTASCSGSSASRRPGDRADPVQRTSGSLDRQPEAGEGAPRAADTSAASRGTTRLVGELPDPRGHGGIPLDRRGRGGEAPERVQGPLNRPTGPDPDPEPTPDPGGPRCPNPTAARPRPVPRPDQRGRTPPARASATRTEYAEIERAREEEDETGEHRAPGSGSGRRPTGTR